MQITKYYCDKCKKEVKKAKDLKELGICVRTSGYSWTDLIRLSLCSGCCEKFGLIKKVIKGDKIVDEPQNIKDKLFDVMADVIDEAGLHNEY